MNSSVKFWLIQISLAFALVFGIIFCGLKFLETWTRHDQFVEVPDLSKKSISQVSDILGDLNLRYEVLDSTSYNPKYPRFSVISQEPKPKAKVKLDRKIYLTINPSNYPKVTIPKVLFVTRRSAEATIKAVGLSVGKTTYVNNIGKDVVLRMFYNGKEIKPGESLIKTSVIDFECGNGIDPNLPIELQNTQTEHDSL